MSRPTRNPATAFLRGVCHAWIDGRKPLEELHLCDEGDQVRVEIIGPYGEDVVVDRAVVTIKEMGNARGRAGRRTVKELRAQNAASPKEDSKS